MSSIISTEQENAIKALYKLMKGISYENVKTQIKKDRTMFDLITAATGNKKKLTEEEIIQHHIIAVGLAGCVQEVLEKHFPEFIKK